MVESYKLSGPTWGIWETPRIPLKDVEVRHVDRAVPESIQRYVDQTWKTRVEEKKAKLEKTTKSKRGIPRPELFIETDETGLPTLYEQTQDEVEKIMWSSDQVTLTGYEIEDEQITLRESPLSYAEYLASLNSEYLELCRKADMKPPTRPLGSSVYIETGDRVPLTVRTKKTNIYPCGLYGIGGNAAHGQTPIAHMIEEIEEEAGLKVEEDFDPNNIMLIGIGADKVLGNKPELISTIKLPNVKRKKIKSTGQPDVGGYKFINSEKDKLAEEIALLSAGRVEMNPALAEDHNVWDGKLIPPAEASLVALGAYRHGMEWVRKVAGDLNLDVRSVSQMIV